MFPPMDLETEQMVLRPMNCPHHILVYESKQRSYRDLPVRIAELGTMYRYERSGALSGLSRVRAMTLNDAHIFCTPGADQGRVLRRDELVEQAYRDLGITQYTYRLSLHDDADKEKYVDNAEMWALGERVLREAMDSLGLPYVEAPRRSGVLRPQARHPACRRDGARRDLFHHPGGLSPAEPVRLEIRRRRTARNTVR